MAPVLRALDGPVVREALVTGRVRDALTGVGLGAELALAWRVGASAAFRPVPARLARRGDGRFAYHADPARLPAIDPAATVALRLTTTVAGREPVEATRTTSGAAWALTPKTAPTSGGAVSWDGLAAPVAAFDVAVVPRAVALEGRVLRDHDPTTPAAGAVLAIVDPPEPLTATADAAGFFRLAALPTAALVTLRITHGGDARDVAYRPDYQARINRAVFNVDT
jgi:hypothetical protein